MRRGVCFNSVAQKSLVTGVRDSSWPHSNRSSVEKYCTLACGTRNQICGRYQTSTAISRKPTSVAPRVSRPLGRSYLSTMESLPPPPNADGLLFVLSGAQCDQAMRQRLAGANVQRLSMVKSAHAGQPVFLFDSDARLLHGPYAAAGPGGLNLDGANSRLPAQLRFTSVVRAFAPLPEADVTDLLHTSELGGGKGRRPVVQSSIVDGATVGQLLLLFVLNHHGLLA